MSKLFSIFGAFGVAAAIAGPTYVTLQTNSPGIAETGHINVSGVVAGSIIRVDNSNSGSGKLLPGLIFGPTNSGEGIGSARVAASQNLNGVDIYTNSTARLSVTNSGNVGIGTKSPSEKLHVQGNITATGKINATNLPAIKMKKEADILFEGQQSSQTSTIIQLPINVPSAGYLKITTNMMTYLDNGQIVYCETLLDQSRVSFFTLFAQSAGLAFPISKETVVPITAGSHSLSTTAFVYLPPQTYPINLSEPTLIVEFYPNTL